MRLRSIHRVGMYYRLFKLGWSDPLDPSYAKAVGGRWTPKGEFGAIHLNENLTVAAANARSRHAGRSIGLFDLRPEKRPWLVDVSVPFATAVDVVSSAGLAAAGLPERYPFGVDHAACWPIARTAYVNKALAGIASRSKAECTRVSFVGEELAWFDRSPALVAIRRRSFENWYPEPHP